MSGRSSVSYRAYLTQWDEHRERGRREVRSAGFVPDGVLARDLSGEASDERHGVAVVTRPPPAVVEVVREAQAKLGAVDDRQYFYPPGDLHLTVLEIHHSRPRPVEPEAVEQIVTVVRSVAKETPTPLLLDGRIGFDRATVTMGWLPADERLEQLRERLAAGLRDAGVRMEARHARPTAHVTFVRYLAEPGEAAAWIETLDALQERVMESTWKVRNLVVTAGATWYGRRERIRAYGPFALLDV